MPDTSPQTIKGIFFACLSTSLGGMTVALTRLIIHDTGPLSLAFIRYGLGAVVLLGIFYLVQKRQFPKMPGRDMIILAVIGIVMFASFPYFMARALEDTTAARGALVFTTLPLISMVLGAIFGIERLSGMKMIAVVVAIAGTTLALSERIEDIAPNAFRGDLYMLAGTMGAASFNVFARKSLQTYGNMPVLLYTMFIGITVLFGLALVYEAPLSGSLDFDAMGWFVVFMLGVPGAALMMFTWSRALQLITPTQATITVGLNPLTAILLGAVLLSEPITLHVLGGFILVVLAVILAHVRPPRVTG
ncbi:MAG: DMT family transporter [Rhodospirillales bacterium]|nr:DMT family transporter [Rhodospirillales bacterium]